MYTTGQVGEVRLIVKKQGTQNPLTSLNNGNKTYFTENEREFTPWQH